MDAMITFLLALQLFIPAPLVQRGPETLSEGTWESCQQDDGDFAEKALDYKINGKPWFEIHYGPRDEFAIFAGNTDEHIAHNDDLNLLKPAFHYDDVLTVAGGRNWSIASLGIHLNVIRLQGHLDCYTYVTKIERDKRPMWADR
jgi:hypothetical protein